MKIDPTWETDRRAVRLLRIAAVVVPALCAAPRLADEPHPPPEAPPPPHATDVWLGQAGTLTVDPRWAAEVDRQRLQVKLPTAGTPSILRAPASVALGNGFTLVGSVAVLAGDATTVGGAGTHIGIASDNLAEVGRRFIAAFGDDYDQIAVFLAFTDSASPQSLAYQMPIKNDVKGLGLNLFDSSATYGSPSGRLQTMLNMKRILAYGRTAADDPDNDLYAVWAQEAAHRWIVYFRYEMPGDTMPNTGLLGRQMAHWARNVQADGSFMDGYLWTDNGDGTFTPSQRDTRYGNMDQYGMGLRLDKDVPPFFLLDNVLQASDDMPVNVGLVEPGARYKATKTVITVADVERALGPRQPPTDVAATDLRMGVVLLTPPGVPADEVTGESFRIDSTRGQWDTYYNTAADGRGKVCTSLVRPCRGMSLTYGDGTIAPADAAPGGTFTLTVPVSNAGTAAGDAKIQASGRGTLTFTSGTADLGTLAVGQGGTATFQGRVPLGTPCATLIPVDLASVDRSARPAPSQGSVDVLVGAVPALIDGLEDARAATWKVNPDGKDTATAGAWELGTPQRSEAFDFVLQPGAAFSGAHAFVTGAAMGANPNANAVSAGITTLQSPPYDLTMVHNPHLSYEVYFVATDFQNEVLVPADGDVLQVLASTDATTWTPVDQVTGMALAWQRRLVKLSDKLPPAMLGGPNLSFRFVANNEITGAVVEAVIDDIGLVGEDPACDIPAPDGGTADAQPPPVTGCHCAVGRGRPGVGLALFIVVAAVLGRRRRRR